MKPSLEQINKKIGVLQALADGIKRKRAPVLKRIVRLARSNAISGEEIQTALLARYANPKTGETWSGRGKPARWIVDAEKKGQKRSKFLVK